MILNADQAKKLNDFLLACQVQREFIKHRWVNVEEMYPAFIDAFNRGSVNAARFSPLINFCKDVQDFIEACSPRSPKKRRTTVPQVELLNGKWGEHHSILNWVCNKINSEETVGQIFCIAWKEQQLKLAIKRPDASDCRNVLVGNDPYHFSFPDSVKVPIDCHPIFVAAGALGVLSTIHSLVTPSEKWRGARDGYTGVPKLILMDKSRHSCAVWKITKEVVQSQISDGMDIREARKKLIDGIKQRAFDYLVHIRKDHFIAEEHSRKLVPILKRLNPFFVRNLIQKMTIIHGDWSDPAMFEKLSGFVPDRSAGEASSVQVYALPSNIYECMTDEEDTMAFMSNLHDSKYFDWVVHARTLDSLEGAASPRYFNPDTYKLFDTTVPAGEAREALEDGRFMVSNTGKRSRLPRRPSVMDSLFNAH